MFLIHKAKYLNEKGEDGIIRDDGAWSNIVFPFSPSFGILNHDNVISCIWAVAYLNFGLEGRNYSNR
jgi:hypothetical protein